MEYESVLKKCSKEDRQNEIKPFYNKSAAFLQLHIGYPLYQLAQRPCTADNTGHCSAGDRLFHDDRHDLYRRVQRQGKQNHNAILRAADTGLLVSFAAAGKHFSNTLCCSCTVRFYGTKPTDLVCVRPIPLPVSISGKWLPVPQIHKHHPSDRLRRRHRWYWHIK